MVHFSAVPMEHGRRMVAVIDPQTRSGEVLNLPAAQAAMVVESSGQGYLAGYVHGQRPHADGDGHTLLIVVELIELAISSESSSAVCRQWL